MSPLDVFLIVGPRFDPRVVLLEVNRDLGAVPVHRFPAAKDLAVDGPLATGRVVGHVPLLVDLDRHPSELVVVPELRTVRKIREYMSKLTIVLSRGGPILIPKESQF